MSQHPVELNVVDLVGGLCLEALVYQSEFSLGGLQFHVVKDAAEAGHVHEAGGASVFVLEEWLDE